MPPSPFLLFEGPSDFFLSRDDSVFGEGFDFDEGGLLNSPKKEEEPPLFSSVGAVVVPFAAFESVADAAPKVSSPKCASNAAKPEEALAFEAAPPPPNAESRASKDPPAAAFDEVAAPLPKGSLPKVAEEGLPSKASNLASKASEENAAIAEVLPE